ncbi:flagellar protein FlgN [Piscirickettsia salmonis]|uniref:flagellar protein FlgN n=1 Tax=Piscirickettsia salmonis TaxID=1238 RepID=UPI0007C93201|nr:FlgN protein [Piscirickettsiaceae bacterium NZ-RLO1]
MKSKNICSLLDKKLILLNQLLDFLEQETLALQNLAQAELQQIAKAKETCLTQLSPLALAHEHLLIEKNYDCTHEGMLDYIQQEVSGKEQAQAKQLWLDMTLALKKCKQINEANGLVIQINQAQISSMLNIIKGAEENTYSSQGAKESTASIKNPRSTA